MILPVIELDIDNIELYVDELIEAVAVHQTNSTACIFVLISHSKVLINSSFWAFHLRDLLLELRLIFLSEQ
jgi:hypothetical protein